MSETHLQQTKGCISKETKGKLHDTISYICMDELTC